jgi:hypothetical protein
MHILVFLLAGFLAITLAHPSLFLTDEWVTVNQLNQMHAGHQVILNEGKYGVYENGTPTEYFILKKNYLAYPLFLPLVSLPAYWILDLFGNYFFFFILYLWTFLLIAIALCLNAFFPEYRSVGRWRWTYGFIGVTFIIFFLNLYFFNPTSLVGEGAYPEIVAIVFTNIVLFSFLAVLIYEICKSIFENPEYALFGTLTCISCSSYLFWTSFCKDHILVVFLVTAIILMLVKLSVTDNMLFLAAAFSLSGLLAWARPELALVIAAALCVLLLYLRFFMKKYCSDTRDRCLILLAPLFTFVGAIPFFLNNYLYTHNFFIPAYVLWDAGPSVTVITDSPAAQQNIPDTLGSLNHLLQLGININPSTFFADLYGILFYPRSLSIGVFPLVPLFLTAVLLLPVLFIRQKPRFTQKERRIIGVLLLVSLGVFLAYVRGIAGMNVSHGIVPDMRYLSPLYLPLTLIGLLIFNKISEISGRPGDLIKGMLAAWAIFIPLSLIVLSRYTQHGETWESTYPLLNVVASMGICLLSGILLLSVIRGVIFNKSFIMARISFILVCAAPLIWQIAMTVLAGHIGVGLGGYPFWIPVILNGYVITFGILWQ